jgi:nitrogen fixation protein NifU and related proteins
MEGDAELQDLYREVLLDYFRSTSRKGKLDPADVRAHGINPVCGDELEITARREGGKIAALRYAGHGCVISQASAAMMAEALEGADIPKAKALVAAFKKLMLEQGDVKSLPPELEQLASLEGVRKFPLRVKCATLGWNTVMQGFEAAKS